MATPSWIDATAYATIQQAVNALPVPRGGVVYIPRGIYDSSSASAAFATSTYPTLTLPADRPVYLLGDGPDSTMLKSDRLGTILARDDMISVQGDNCRIEGLSIENTNTSLSPGYSRGIVVGRSTNNPLRKFSMLRCGIRYSRSWAVEFLGVDSGVSGRLAVMCSLREIDVLTPKGGGGLRIGEGCTTILLEKCAIHSFAGNALLLFRAQGCQVLGCAFEGQIGSYMDYVQTVGGVELLFDGCWFESHVDTDASDVEPFLHIGTSSDPTHGVAVIGCHFVRGTNASGGYAKAIVIDGASHSVAIVNPRIVLSNNGIPTPSLGADDIKVSSSGRVAIIGGVLQDASGIKPYRLSNASDYATLLGAIDRLRIPSITTNTRNSSLDYRVGDIIYNKDIAAHEVLYVTGAWSRQVRRIGDYDANNIGDLTTPHVLVTPTIASTYRVALAMVTTTAELITLTFRVNWVDEFANNQFRTIQLNLGTVGNHTELDFTLYSAANQSITLSTTAAAPSGRVTIHARVEAV